MSTNCEQLNMHDRNHELKKKKLDYFSFEIVIKSIEKKQATASSIEDDDDGKKKKKNVVLHSENLLISKLTCLHYIAYNI